MPLRHDSTKATAGRLPTRSASFPSGHAPGCATPLFSLVCQLALLVLIYVPRPSHLFYTPTNLLRARCLHLRTPLVSTPTCTHTHTCTCTHMHKCTNAHTHARVPTCLPPTTTTPTPPLLSFALPSPRRDLHVLDFPIHLLLGAKGANPCTLRRRPRRLRRRPPGALLDPPPRRLRVSLRCDLLGH